MWLWCIIIECFDSYFYSLSRTPMRFVISFIFVFSASPLSDTHLRVSSTKPTKIWSGHYLKPSSWDKVKRIKRGEQHPLRQEQSHLQHRQKNSYLLISRKVSIHMSQYLTWEMCAEVNVLQNCVVCVWGWWFNTTHVVSFLPGNRWCNVELAVHCYKFLPHPLHPWWCLGWL